MASQGPNGPDNYTTAMIGEASVSWTDDELITAEDGNCAESSVGTGLQSSYLIALDFGFNIPSGATIDGVLVEWKKWTSSGVDVSDYSVKLYYNSSTIGSDKADTVSSWPGTLGAFTGYGGDEDVWGATLVDSTINSSTFGCAISAQGLIYGGTAAVDYVRMTVYYTEGSVSGFVQSCKVVRPASHPMDFE